LSLASAHLFLNFGAYFDTRRKSMTLDFGVWVKGMQDSEKGTFLAHRSKDIMRDIW
jgi:hypothetical protein